MPTLSRHEFLQRTARREPRCCSPRSSAGAGSAPADPGRRDRLRQRLGAVPSASRRSRRTSSSSARATSSTTGRSSGPPSTACRTTIPHIDQMLAGAPFDLLVNLTDMQEHGRLNRQALLAGRHVWSEKPMANTYREGRALLELAKADGFVSGARRRWSTARSSPSWRRRSGTAQLGTRVERARALRPPGPDLVGVLLREGRRQPARPRRLQPRHADRPARPGARGDGDDRHRHARAKGRRQGHGSPSRRKTTPWS